MDAMDAPPPPARCAARSPSLLHELCARKPARLRIILISAHPDDETIGAGARLCHWRPHLQILQVTNGTPRHPPGAHRAGAALGESYRQTRRRERNAALALAGIRPGQVRELGFVDQEAALHLEELADMFAEVFIQSPAVAVVTHAFEGGHPDHDATAWAVQVACARLGARAPARVEMTSYHQRDGQMATGEFLPHPGCRPLTVELDEAERALKIRMFECFRSQRQVLRDFGQEVERFRIAPLYDLSAPAPAGALFYENFPWGMNGARWLELARRAHDALRKKTPSQSQAA